MSMNVRKADLILHPVRIRIITLLAGSRKLTPQQIAEQLPDIPQATLYRQLGILARGGILTVENHRQVRGTVEKIYSLPEGNAVLGKEDVDEASSEEHMRLFSTFLSILMNDFGRYLAQERYDVYADGVSYRKMSVYLDDEEFLELLMQIRELINRASENTARAGRRLRNLAVIAIPEPADHPIPKEK